MVAIFNVKRWEGTEQATSTQVSLSAATRCR